MNLILLDDADFVAPDRALLTGRRLAHIRGVLKLRPGGQLRVGRVGGLLGEAEIIGLGEHAAELRVHLHRPPPPRLPLTLLLALPRPKAARRILRAVAEMGVTHVVLLNAWKVEKSYWQSPLLAPAAIRATLLEGLEQAGDTVLPRVQLAPRFKPFVEDLLPELVGALPTDTVRLLAHPGSATSCPHHLQRPALAAIGPDGGFTPYEVGKFVAAGFEPVNLGPRILRVEHAVVALIARACG